MDKRLAKVPYLAGAYSIADMAVWPWLRYPDRQGVNVDDYPEREALARSHRRPPRGPARPQDPGR